VTAAASVPAGHVATGHTRDDAIETVLLHVLRGSGAAGLGGIAEFESFPAETLGGPRRESDATARVLLVVRPLLDVGRADTVAYCQARGLAWRDDETNADPRFLRNRIRNHLLPVLRTYNPAIDDAIARLATVMAEEDACLSALVASRMQQFVRRNERGASIARCAWDDLPVALQRRAVRAIAAEAGYTEIGFDAVERALAVGRRNGPRQTQLGGGLVVRRTIDSLIVETHEPVTPQPEGDHDGG
jgi:tRNA(Ile)-lysidine synthase